MFLKVLKARKVDDVGASLADQIAPVPPAGQRSRRPAQQDLRSFLAKVDSEARPLRLGLFKRARLANSFKWRLLDNGVEAPVADELTRILLMRINANQGSAPEVNVPASVARALPVFADVNSLVSKAEAFAAQGAHERAMSCYQQVLDIKPRHLVARNNLGVALLKQGRYAEAEEQFRKAVAIKPAYAEAQFNLGTVLRLRGRMAESETPLRRAVRLSAKNTEAQASLGMTLLLQGRLRDAAECFERTLRTQPHHPGALQGLGQIAALEGRFSEAEDIFRRVLAQAPRMPAAWAALAGLRKMTPVDATWLRGAEEIAAGGLAPLEEADLRYAIGKYWDDLGDFERAFRSYERANALQRSASGGYDTAERTCFVQSLIEAASAEALAVPQAGSSGSVAPVFVVGMMRSGTSLVEQIVASHPAGAGAGELQFWHDAVRKHGTALPEAPLRQKLAQSYLRVLSANAPAAQRVVDKTPFNSDYLGLIHSVFPNARIIYVRRDPIDTCLSCYFQQFAAHGFTTDLADLAHYYRSHRRLMDHWRAVLPAGALLEVPYEKLVADQESWTRKIIEFIGLPWDERCLSFHTTRRAVVTASYWQVKQKIYRSSVGRRRHYDKFLGPLRDLTP